MAHDVEEDWAYIAASSLLESFGETSEHTERVVLSVAASLRAARAQGVVEGLTKAREIFEEESEKFQRLCTEILRR